MSYGITEKILFLNKFKKKVIRLDIVYIRLHDLRKTFGYDLVRYECTYMKEVCFSAVRL